MHSLNLFIVSLQVTVGLAATLAPSQVAVDFDLLSQRRLSAIVGASTDAANVGNWLGSLDSDGRWPDLDYTTGCDAQRASWPAQKHWQRLHTLAAAWHGGFKNAVQWARNETLGDGIALAMDSWFAEDFTNPDCIDFGGEDECPCGTPGLWNTNWFSNVLGIPAYVGEACFLMNDTLSDTAFGNCTKFGSRAYDSFVTGINGVKAITGSNALDLASIGLDLGLLTENETLITDVFARVHDEVVVQDGVKADGIRADGSFGQHTGIIYNGNYGKDYTNDVFGFEIVAAGTEFQATDESRSAFETLWDGNVWMIFRNAITNVTHWDFNVIGRMIALPVADKQASQNLKINLTLLQSLADSWDSAPLKQAYQDVSAATDDANSGNLQGNRVFFANDYVVQRGPGYVSHLRMYSERTVNSECTNSQNPFGFHLADGALYTRMTGDEYEDITAAWDWNLIPGTTVDYNATDLNCSDITYTGTRALVGGVSDGNIGVAAMRYENPSTKSLSWQKAWFFLPNDVQHVMIAGLTSATDAPVFSVLDQRKLDDEILVDGEPVTNGNYTGVSTLFHGGVGYAFNSSNDAVSLSVQSGERTGSWTSISTSKQPDETVELFSAWLAHNDTSTPVEYTVYPATTASSFESKAENRPITIQNDDSISAVLDEENNVAMFVFWDADGGSATIPSIDGAAEISVTSNRNIALIVHLDDFDLTVADPTQTLSNVTLTFELGCGSTPAGWCSDSMDGTTTVDLPSGGIVGGSVSSSLF